MCVCVIELIVSESPPINPTIGYQYPLFISKPVSTLIATLIASLVAALGLLASPLAIRVVVS